MEQLPVLPALGVEHGLKFKVEDVSSIVGRNGFAEACRVKVGKI